VAEDLEISPTVRALISASIRSIEELELLLLLRSRARPRPAPELARELGISESIAVFALQNLVQSRLLVQQSDSSPLSFSFAPQRRELSAAIEELAQVYEQSRLDLIVLISSGAIDRLRSGMRDFSDTLGAKARKKSD
jgi:predicted transcriptional regulator